MKTKLAKLTPGAAVLVTDDSGTHHYAIVLDPPWQLGHGAWVINCITQDPAVRFRAYSVQRVKPIKNLPYYLGYKQALTDLEPLFNAALAASDQKDQQLDAELDACIDRYTALRDQITTIIQLIRSRRII